MADKLPPGRILSNQASPHLAQCRQAFDQALLFSPATASLPSGGKAQNDPAFGA
jgi:hypothetical protein